jgi:tRNA(adenine34) deaminase
MLTDEQYMKLAIAEAQKAFEKDEVPVGAILVIDNKIVARSHNQVELLQDSTAHAEVLALTTAYSALGTKYVTDATLYVTLEPCLMCCGALHWSKINKVVFGAYDVKNGYKKYTGENNPFHPKTILLGGILEDECSNLLKSYFKAKR